MNPQAAEHLPHREPAGDTVPPAPVAPPAYEPPQLTPLGNLRDVLGKSGGRSDFGNRLGARRP
ncbi:MAG: hypothetical protein JNM56_24365 [Planctomycetia bacterium]|nr:hypothetical protein [Planctomycetia bacterium]